MEPIGLLLVDDNPLFLSILSDFVRQDTGLAILGTTQDGMEALALAGVLRPQIALVDIAMPGMSGLEIIPRLRAALPKPGIIVLTLHDENGYRQAALTAGADEFVSKAALYTDLLPAIRRVAQANCSRSKPAGDATTGAGDARR